MLTPMTVTLLALSASSRPGAHQDDVKGDKMADRQLSSFRLARIGVKPGDWVSLIVGEPLQARLDRCTFEVFDAAGRSIAKPTLKRGSGVVCAKHPSGRSGKRLPTPFLATPFLGGEQRVWRVPTGACGVHRLGLSLPGDARRDLWFNVLSGRPRAGACAHRGDCRVAPENTLPAIRSAVEKGAHQIEFDVQMSKDGRLVIMHDRTLDRTTNGKGPVGDMTFDELRALDAGSWKDAKYAGTKIPTFREVVQAVPPAILLNCHLRRAPGLAAEVTRQIVEMGRMAQCFLACDTTQAAEAKAVCPDVKICNMSGQRGPASDYPDRTIRQRAEFIQIIGWHDSMPPVCAKLHKHGVTVNYFGTQDAALMRRLIESGVNYVLTDDLDLMLKVLAEYGIKPVRTGR